MVTCKWMVEKVLSDRDCDQVCLRKTSHWFYLLLIRHGLLKWCILKIIIFYKLKLPLLIQTNSYSLLKLFFCEDVFFCLYSVSVSRKADRKHRRREGGMTDLNHCIYVTCRNHLATRMPPRSRISAEFLL